MSKERAKNIDKKMFDCIKILLEGKASYTEIQDFTNVGRTTISRIAHSESWEDYEQQMAAMRAAWHCRVAEKKAKEQAVADRAMRAMEEKEKVAKAVAEAVKAVPAASLIPQPKADPVYGANRICELLTHQNEILKAISNKLAFIVDELTGVTPPKGGEPA